MVLIPGLMRKAPSGGLRADPTQLPEATKPGQTRSGGSTYGRSLAANQTYVDPVSGVTVLKVTSGSVPIGGQTPGISHGYATSGPRVSQPWVDSGDGHTKYTLCLDFISHMVDIDYNDFQAENFRNVGDAAGPGDTGMAFSMNTATPRISYYLDGTVIRRFNTATNADAASGIFPYTIAVGSGGVLWFGTMIDDAWMAWMRGTEFMALKTSDSTLRRASQARTTLAHDELHLDLLNPFVYMVTDNGLPNYNALWNLVADTIDITPGTQNANGPMISSHSATGPGYSVGTAALESGGGMFLYRGDTNTISQPITDYTDYHSADEWYTNADWCFNLPAGYSVPGDGWHLTVLEDHDEPTVKVREYMMAFVKNDGSSIRVIGHHDSSGVDYDHFSKARLSPDGKLVVWTSDMNNSSGRWDVFVAKMPVI